MITSGTNTGRLPLARDTQHLHITFTADDRFDFYHPPTEDPGFADLVQHLRRYTRATLR